MMNRSEFIEILSLGSVGYFAVNYQLTTKPKYPFSNLSEAFQAIGFNPKKKGNSFFVTTADVHYGMSEGMLPTINEVNKMHPLPAFFCVDGDMILHGSSSFGIVPNRKDRQLANNEFKAFKKDLDQLNSQIRCILVLGNHDQAPKAVDSHMFWKVFPTSRYPAYQSMDLEDCHLIFLNGHTTGYIDTRQMQWLKRDINSIPNTQTVIVFIHQPSMSHRVQERKIPAAISKAFINHKGLIWYIGGHEHTNFQEIFQLKNTKLIEHGIVCGAKGVWGGPEKPGYWIYCLRNGQVVGRIFKHLPKGYQIQPSPDLTHARVVPKPFDNCTNLVWKSLVGGKNNSIVKAKARDCFTWLAYVKKLIYKLPLKETNNTAERIALLTSFSGKNATKPEQYFISPDLQHWQQVPLGEEKEDLLVFQIPKSLQNAEEVYFKFIPIPKSGGVVPVAGIALLNSY